MGQQRLANPLTPATLPPWLLAVSLVTLLVPLDRSAQAQITHDGTLPTVVNSANGLDYRITGGSQAGGNLFHSFGQFSIPTGGSGFFDNALTIQNIIGRVTGGLPSEIDGLLRANGTANLFLLNPSGISFGSNASLQLGGSFFASTATTLQFADGSEFSAVNPQPAPLLTINLPPGAQLYGQGQTPIVNAGNLAVGNEQSVTLLGSDVTIRGILTAPGGRVEVLGDRVALLNNAVINVSSPTGGGTVFLGGNYRGQGTLPNALQTYVAPTAMINANATNTGNGGNVVVWADDTTHFYGSISAQGGSRSGNGGNVEVSGSQSLIFNGFVNTSAPAGNTGTLLLDPTNITVIPGNVPSPPNAFDGQWSTSEDPGDQTIGSRVITALLSTNALTLEATDTISFMPNADVIVLSANTLTLHARNINLTGMTLLQLGAGDIVLDTTQNQGTSTQTTQATSVLVNNSVIGTANAGAVPRVGKLQVITGSLTVSNGGGLTSSTLRVGDAGNVELAVSGAAIFDGTGQFPAGAASVAGTGASIFDPSQFPSGAASIVFPNARGNGGNVELTAGSLTVSNGAQLNAGTFGRGNAGSVKLTVSGVTNFDGSLRGAYSQVNPGAVGNAGNVELTAGSLIVTNGAQLSASALGVGNGGDVKLVVSGAANFDGEFSGAFSSVSPDAVGNSGNVELTADSLTVTNGARLSASTSSVGNAGNVNLTITGSATFDGTSPGRPSGVSSVVAPNAVGNGGNIELDAGSLRLTNGAQINSSTFGAGNAGNVNLFLKDNLSIEGSDTGLFAVTTSTATGNGGSIFVDSPQVTLSTSAVVSVNSQGSGNGGSIQLQAGNLTFTNQGAITAETASGEGGNITLRVDNRLLLRTNSLISATAGGTGNGGNLDIRTGEFIIAVPYENSDIIANAFQGKGGNINISTQAIFGLEFRSRLTPLSDITASSEFGLQGNVVINTPNVDPSRGIVQLPSGITDASQQISQGCRSGGQAGRFVVIGKGGLPANPGDTIAGDALWEDMRGGGTAVAQTGGQPSQSTTNSTVQGRSLVPAQGWVIDEKGMVTLVASPHPLACHEQPKPRL